MSLSAERIAIADRAILQTFERSSVAWQTVPHWDTGDRGQSLVRGDIVSGLPGPGASATLRARPLAMRPLRLKTKTVTFLMTLGQATATTPDALLAAVIPRAVELAALFDNSVLAAVRKQAVAAGRAAAAAAPVAAPAPAPAPESAWYPKLAAPVVANAATKKERTTTFGTILEALIKGRQVLEDNGYRSPSCIIASTAHFTDLSQWAGIRPATEALLTGHIVNSLIRASQLDRVDVSGTGTSFMIMLGRQQAIAQGAAATASPGEEPVDLAISVPPSLEVVGENANGLIELAVRMSFATRVKDARGVVVFHT
jgi:hypothetical protein